MPDAFTTEGKLSISGLEGYIGKENIAWAKTTPNAEDKLRTIARLYALHSQIIQAILHITDEQELLQTICSVAIQYGQFRMAWIGIKDESVDIVKPLFFAGHEEGYLSQIQITTSDRAVGGGPSSQALLEGQICSTYDIASDTRMLQWREEALRRGYRSSAAVPFKRKGKVFGILNLYASEPGFFTPDEQKMLQEIGDNISFALNASDSETQRKLTQEALIESFVGVATDISIRKKAEIALQKSQRDLQLRETYLSSVIQNHPGRFWLKDIQGRFLFSNKANDRFMQITLGLDDPEIVGKTESALRSPGEAKQLLKEDQAVISNKRTLIQVEKFQIDNKDLWYEKLKFPVIDEKGETIGVAGYSIDITNRKETEEALRFSEERWQFALEGAGDGIWDCNVATNSVFYSTQWKRMLGYEDDDMDNQIDSWRKLIHPDDLICSQKSFKEYVEGLIPMYYFKYRIRCKDQSYKWVLSRGKIMERDLYGQPLRVIGTHTDITEIKLAEEKLKENIEREKELNEIKSRFVANASHEFRTPLATILLANDALISYWKKMEENQIQDRLDKIRNNVLHLTRIVNDILQLSKIEDRKIEFNPVQIDIISLCRTIIDEFGSSQYSNEIRFQYPFNSLVVSVDERLMRQALNNLLSNALKYSPDNLPVSISIQKQHSELTIHVTDQGIGIPDADQKHLFTPFFRASNSKLIQGNGLGLNILRESIHLHGGEITFTSKINEGSSFVIHLPANRVIDPKFLTDIPPVKSPTHF